MPVSGMRFGQPKQVIRNEVAEPSVNLAQGLCGQGMTVDSALIDPGLHGNVRLGLKLQMPPFRVRAVVIVAGTLDVDRRGVVTFDQVAVMTIHCPHQIGQRTDDSPWQTVSQPGRSCSQVDGEVAQAGTVPGRATDEQRLRQADAFAAVWNSLFHVRFIVRIRLGCPQAP